jgi:hypothetical protein
MERTLWMESIVIDVPQNWLSLPAPSDFHHEEKVMSCRVANLLKYIHFHQG